MKKQTKRIFSAIFCFVLIAALALTACSCGGKNNDNSGSPSSVTVTDNIGSGSTTFGFTATLKDGVVKNYLVSTDKATVGEALSELGIISGEEGPYGLYVKTVCGQTLDYDTDGYYWAFYENGNYAVSGVDTTNIDTTVTYELRAQK